MHLFFIVTEGIFSFFSKLTKRTSKEIIILLKSITLLKLLNNELDRSKKKAFR